LEQSGLKDGVQPSTTNLTTRGKRGCGHNTTLEIMTVKETVMIPKQKCQK
jgi:hypothetical protein